MVDGNSCNLYPIITKIAGNLLRKNIQPFGGQPCLSELSSKVFREFIFFKWEINVNEVRLCKARLSWVRLSYAE